MKKPHVICHMASTVDGRIISANWGEHEKRKTYSALYEQCHGSFDTQAWMCGRVTMEKDFSKGEVPELLKPEKPIARTAYVADKNATSFAIAIDAKGKLGWKSNELGGDHIIEVLTESVPDEYLFYLQRKNVSYIFAGKDALDFKVALDQLTTHFPIDTIMLEGGGHINGSLLNAGLIDELSLLILPIADGSVNAPTTFEVGEDLPKKHAASLQLAAVEKLEGDVLWLRYKMIYATT